MNIAKKPEVYWREMIKPSSQTPTHLKTHIPIRPIHSSDLRLGPLFLPTSRTSSSQ
ncbi:hypothetical protein LINGRAHAP2_LOCUS11617 [Linum grandiflorum]